jgi:hypothetical protein
VLLFLLYDNVIAQLAEGVRFNFILEAVGWLCCVGFIVVINL